jgi:hypothetical protein
MTVSKHRRCPKNNVERMFHRRDAKVTQRIAEKSLRFSANALRLCGKNITFSSLPKHRIEKQNWH